MSDLIERLREEAKNAGWDILDEAAAELTSLRELLAACAEYLREGETPAECIVRNRADANYMLDKFAKAKAFEKEYWESQARQAELERNVRLVSEQLAAAQAAHEETQRELLAESKERIDEVNRHKRTLAELEHLEQAYANRHSPQHRAAALNSARGRIDAVLREMGEI